MKTGVAVLRVTGFVLQPFMETGFAVLPDAGLHEGLQYGLYPARRGRHERTTLKKLVFRNGGLPVRVRSEIVLLVHLRMRGD